MNKEEIEQRIRIAQESDVVTKASLLVQLAEDYLTEYYKSLPIEQEQSLDE